MTTTEEPSLAALAVPAQPSRAWVGWLLGVCATIGFSLATPISRHILLSGTTPHVLLILRLGMASILMGSTWAVYKPSSLNFGRKAFAIVCLLGVLSGISTLCYNWALTRLDSSMAVMIYAINPVVALSFLWLGGEKMTRRQIMRLALALSGVYLLIGPGGNVSLWGVGLMFISMLTWSAQMVGVQWYLRDKDSGAISFYIAASSVVIIIGYWLTQGGVFQSPPLYTWLLILVQVIVATYIARLCFFTAIQKIGSGQMALLMPLETMLSITWSMTFLGERIGWLQAVGGLLILISAILAFERLGRLRTGAMEGNHPLKIMGLGERVIATIAQSFTSNLETFVTEMTLAEAEEMAAKNVTWNFWVSVWDTVFIMAGLSIVSRDTIMPALVTQLTDSKLAIGLIAALYNLGMYLPQLFVANRTERIRYKLPYLIWGSALFERGPYLLIAGAIWWFADPSPFGTLLLFFVLLTSSSVTVGFLVPAWYDMIAKVIPVEMRGRYSGIGHAIGALVSMGCAYWAGTVLDKVSYPNNFALLFLASYVVMFLSWIALALTREPPSLTTKQHMPFARFIGELPTILRRDHNYARFLLSRTTIQLGMLANGFFIVYGIEQFGIDGIFIGNLTVVLVATQAVMSLVWGYVADRTGYKTLLAAAAFALALAAAVALVVPSAIWLVAVYILLGIYTGADYVAGLNIILEFSPAEDRPTYIGLTNSLLAPSLTLGPLIGGWLAGMLGYSGLFMTALVIVLIGGLMMTFLVREPRKSRI